MNDDHVLGFLRRQAEHARWITSVCTGSLLLGAAGLLQGRRATTHWAYTDVLPIFGAIATEARVVIDGKLITGGGVTSGIDFALVVASQIAGEEAAKRIALMLEYDPEPPFRSGHPRVADPQLVTALRATLGERRSARMALARGVAEKMPS
jgi:cyclohexyl-isocyanide hydratase